ncbi:AraC family transcriptional regulator [Mangrovibacterium diazotrophicum]|uniref:AraC family transcriptional regulator n=1 Tax=Mangrovibacterium diazotrophicum TaxID=1261403 RepID=A0A419W632_9BACT|nr:AraC family transcriptional regulator [Mangrovibacterium diazotrophicum]RKD90921.1 AraC family transcriptional regulator [Mangrovibacterium diazotrophicum]
MKKQDGFPGQQSYVIPERIVDQLKISPLCNDIYLTDIGYYPEARHHFRERPTGSDQTILIYNVEGTGNIIVGNQKMQLPADHFFIIPEGVPHAYSADANNPWSIYWIHFAGPKARHLGKPGLQAIPVPRSSNSRTSERLELFNELFYILERGHSFENLEYISQSLPRLIASFTYLTQFRSINEQFSKDPVSQSINFMLENINRKFKLDELASAVKLSASHYSRLFLYRTGHSPIDYFIQLKIQRACRLLDSDDRSIADIARDIGFDDQFYFSRQFKKVMGLSPREYRKR